MKMYSGIARWLSLLSSVAAVARAASTPIATNPVLTTITTTSTRLSIRTVSTSTSTTTPILCPDGTCIAISLVEIPILSTSTILSVGTVVSTVGFSTIYSQIPDAPSPAPAPAPATPTPNANITPSTSPSPTPIPGTLQAAPSSVVTTTDSSGQPSVVTVFASASPSTDASSREMTVNGDNSSNGGLETKYIAVIAVLAVVVCLAIVGMLVFLFIRRRRRNAVVASATSNATDDVAEVVGGRHELDHKATASVAELGNTGRQIDAELSATGDGYRGTVVPNAWNAGAPASMYAMSELPGQSWGHYTSANVHEAGSNARYELR